jgi:hypothetical protein
MKIPGMKLGVLQERETGRSHFEEGPVKSMLKYID